MSSSHPAACGQDAGRYGALHHIRWGGGRSSRDVERAWIDRVNHKPQPFILSVARPVALLAVPTCRACTVAWDQGQNQARMRRVNPCLTFDLSASTCRANHSSAYILISDTDLPPSYYPHEPLPRTSEEELGYSQLAGAFLGI